MLLLFWLFFSVVLLFSTYKPLNGLKIAHRLGTPADEHVYDEDI